MGASGAPAWLDHGTEDLERRGAGGREQVCGHALTARVDPASTVHDVLVGVREQLPDPDPPRPRARGLFEGGGASFRSARCPAVADGHGVLTAPPEAEGVVDLPPSSVGEQRRAARAFAVGQAADEPFICL
ncbi:hypothetical protein HHL19_20120 [Streptomyces sp. R302]|uniref:hypothetical protein n=1 Tax=unclassified Streptomyces TaxID=2593676 RepID=UPI00145FB24E|nr:MULTISPECIES: hypothetical protein [unclassified Streptomyces]NML50816.1 hypothetical protein [Streptomyces sp. R301]NML80910.1 hypothetical protein [Streptomyces sp. R302]